METEAENSPRLLTYRAQTIKRARFQALFGLFYLSVGGAGHLFCSRSANWDIKEFADPLLLFFTFGVLILGHYFLFIRQNIRLEAQAFHDGLHLRWGSRVEKILYREVDAIEYEIKNERVRRVWLFYRGGEIFSFTPMLERSDYLIEPLMKNRPDLLSKADYEELIAGLVQEDHYIGRKVGKNTFLSCLFYFIHFFILPLILIAALYSKQIEFLYIHKTPDYLIYYGRFWLTLIIATLFLKFVVFDKFYSQRILQNLKRQLDKNIKNRKRDLLFEKILFPKSYFLFFVVLIGLYLSSYQLDLNLLRPIRLNKLQTQDFGISDGFHLLDFRYRGTHKKYFLRKNDLVLFEDPYSGEKKLGLIEGLPGEELIVQNFDKKGRALASQRVYHLGDNQIALKNGVEVKLARVIEAKSIIGKIKIRGLK